MAEGYTQKEMLTEVRKDVKALSEQVSQLTILQEQTLAQATKTNGRVLELEKRADKQDIKWAVVSGVVGIITFLGLPNVVSVLASI